MRDVPRKSITFESLVEMFHEIESATPWDLTNDMLWGYFFLAESLPVVQRNAQVGLRHLNPLTQLRGVWALPQLRWLLLITFFYAFPFAILQSTSSVLIKDSLGWNADGIGLVFLMLGVMDILDRVGGGNQPEILSTHPKPANRKEYIEGVIKDVFPNGVPEGLDE